MNGRRQIVLTVHGVGELARPMGDDERATTLSPAELDSALEVIAGKPWVRLTFDDGNASDLDVALPCLLERGMRATFFVLAGKLGQPGWLNPAGLAELARAGMTVGSHGWAHRSWRGMSPGEAHQELIEAPRVIAEVTGNPVTEVAVPFGSYDRRVLARLRATGITRAHTSDGGAAHAGSWLQPRTSLRRGLTEASVRSLVEEREPAQQRMIRTAKRLVKQYR